MYFRWICAGNYTFSPNTIWTRGTGGAEYALVYLCEALALKGHKIEVFCNCGQEEGFYNMVHYLPLEQADEYNKQSRCDVAVIFRVPIPREWKTGKYVFFSCDQYGAGDWDSYFKFINP